MYGEAGRLSSARGEISLQVLRHALPIIAMANIWWIWLTANASVDLLICEMRAADAVESEQCHGEPHADVKTIYNASSGVCQPLLCTESLTEWLLQLCQLIFEGDLILLVPAKPRYAF